MSKAIAEKDFEKAMSLRDPEIFESLEGFVAVSSLHHSKKVPEEQRMRVAISLNGRFS